MKENIVFQLVFVNYVRTKIVSIALEIPANAKLVQVVTLWIRVVNVRTAMEIQMRFNV